MNNYLLNNPENMLLSDIFPKGSLTNDIFHLETPFVTPSYSDLVTVNSRLEHLSLEINTQSLRIEVERAKRQKLRASLKQFKQSTLSPCSEMAPQLSTRGRDHQVKYDVF